MKPVLRAQPLKPHPASTLLLLTAPRLTISREFWAEARLLELGHLGFLRALWRWHQSNTALGAVGLTRGQVYLEEPLNPMSQKLLV